MEWTICRIRTLLIVEVEQPTARAAHRPWRAAELQPLRHPERAQILSERSESKDRHPLASRDLHVAV